MNEVKSVNAVQLARDTKYPLNWVIKCLHDWKKPYFISKSLLISSTVLKKSRAEVLKAAKNFACVEYYSFDHPKGEAEVRTILRDYWRTRFAVDLAREKSSKKIAEMISEASEEKDGVQQMAIDKWLILELPKFREAKTLQALAKVCHMPIWISEKIHPDVTAAFERWYRESEKKIKTITTLEECQEARFLLHESFQEKLEKLRSYIFSNEVEKCVSMKRVSFLRRRANTDWERRRVENLAYYIGSKKIDGADTEAKLLRMTRRQLYREYSSQAMLYKLVTFQVGENPKP